MQRLRITFARQGEAKYLSHLEMLKAWERAFRRAGWELAFSHGFNPHPKISFAAALPVGVEAEADLLEVQTEDERSEERAQSELQAALPPGLSVRRVESVSPDLPVIQRSLRAADYEAACPSAPFAAVEQAVERVLVASSLPRRRAREKGDVQYDLRPFIHSLAVTRDPDGSTRVAMRLRTDVDGAGRADEVLRELGIDPAECSIVRRRLVLS